MLPPREPRVYLAIRYNEHPRTLKLAAKLIMRGYQPRDTNGRFISWDAYIERLINTSEGRIDIAKMIHRYLEELSK